MIRLTIPAIEEDDLQAVRQHWFSGHLVQGPRVAAFEQAVAEYVGCQYAVAVSNGTAALHLALLALDIRPGDIVLVTAYSWLSTANVIELCGAQPVFVDIQPDTFMIETACLETALQRLMVVSATAQRVKSDPPSAHFRADGAHASHPRGGQPLCGARSRGCRLCSSLHLAWLSGGHLGRYGLLQFSSS